MPVQDREQAERWFANKTGAGVGAGRRMAALYEVIAEGDASQQPDQERGERTRKPGQTRTGKKPEKDLAAHAAPIPAAPARGAHNQQQATQQQAPGIYINLEIHISADSTPDQIDTIFASMAKHIYRRG